MNPQEQAQSRWETEVSGDERSELERLAELHKLVREVQREHKAKLTREGRKRRRVSRERDEWNADSQEKNNVGE